MFTDYKKGAHADAGLIARSAGKIEWAATASLKPLANNARTHSKKQIESIARSIERFGFMNPILVDRGNEIIAGHGRWAAATLLGLPKVPILIFKHLREAEKRAYILADNKIAEKAGWDREILAIELQTFVDLDFEIELTGFELDEVELILDETAKRQRTSSPKNVAPKSLTGSATGDLGDLWILGKHRLYCGDAGDGQCDFIIRGWQQYTGERAIHAKSGMHFDDHRERRIEDEVKHGQAKRHRKTA